MNAADGRKRQRAVMATDSDWQTVRERAGVAGMDVSRFIVERLTAPVQVPEDGAAVQDLAGAVARIERAVRVLYEVEKQRVEDGAGAETWEALVPPCRDSRGCRGGAWMTAESEEAVLTRIRNALAFLVEGSMREMVRDAREYELKALLTDLFGERAAAATVERLNARMGEEVLDPR